MSAPPRSASGRRRLMWLWVAFDGCSPGTSVGAMSLSLPDRRVAMESSRPAVGEAIRPSIRLSTATLHCTDARELARFYAELTGGAVTAFNGVWAIVTGPGGRIEFQSVADFRSPTWPSGDTPIHMHLDFLVD